MANEAGDWDQWLKGVQDNLESASPVKASAVPERPVPRPIAQAPPTKRPASPARTREPFYWTDMAAFAGQVISVIAAAAYVGRAVSSKAMPAELWFGFAMSSVVAFALCGGVRCLVALARMKTSESK